MLGDINNEIDELKRELENLAKVIRSHGKGLANGQARALHEMRSIAEEYDADRKRFKELLDREQSLIGNSLSQFGTTVMRGTKGTSHVASVITDVGKSLSNVMGTFGVVGKVIGGVTLAVIAATSAVLKQNDTVLEGFDDISDFGVTVTQTSAEYRDMMIKAFESMEYTKTFNSVFKGNVETLILNSKNTGQAAQMFSDVLKNARSYRYQLLALGFDTEKQTKLFGEAVANLTLAQLTKNRSAKEVADSANEWVMQTVAYAAATGLSTETLMSMQKQLMSDARFNAMIIEQEQKGKSSVAFNTIMQTLAAVLTKENAVDLISSNQSQIDPVITRLLNLDGISDKTRNTFRDFQEGTEEERIAAIKELGTVGSNYIKANTAVWRANAAAAEQFQLKGKTLAETVIALDKLSKFTSAQELIAESQNKGEDAAIQLREKKQRIEDMLISVMTRFIALISGPITRVFTQVGEVVEKFIMALKFNRMFRMVTGYELTDEDKRQKLDLDISEAQKDVNVANEVLKTTPEWQKASVEKDIRAAEERLKTLKLQRKEMDQTKETVPEKKPVSTYVQPASVIKQTSKQQEKIALPETTPVAQSVTDSSLEMISKPKQETFKKLSLPKAATGAVFDGAQTGYKVELHAREAVIPMKETRMLNAYAPLKGNRAVPVSVSVSAEFDKSIAGVNMTLDRLQDEIIELKKTSNNDYASTMEQMSVEVNEKLQTVSKAVSDLDSKVNSLPKSKTVVDTSHVIQSMEKLILQFETVLNKSEEHRRQAVKMLETVKKV